MKKEKRDVFISDDGKVFIAEWECKKHEAHKKLADWFSKNMVMDRIDLEDLPKLHGGKGKDLAILLVDYFGAFKDKIVMTQSELQAKISREVESSRQWADTVNNNGIK